MHETLSHEDLYLKVETRIPLVGSTRLSRPQFCRVVFQHSWGGTSLTHGLQLRLHFQQRYVHFRAQSVFMQTSTCYRTLLRKTMSVLEWKVGFCEANASEQLHVWAAYIPCSSLTLYIIHNRHRTRKCKCQDEWVIKYALLNEFRNKCLHPSGQDSKNSVMETSQTSRCPSTITMSLTLMLFDFLIFFPSCV